MSKYKIWPPLTLVIVAIITAMSCLVTAVFAKSVAIEFTDAEQAFIAQSKGINLASGDSFEPFTILNADGSISGFDADILALISQRTGLDIRLTLGDWTQMQLDAQQRKFDGLSSASVSPQRKQHYHFTQPYTQLFSVVLVKTGNPNNIRNIRDLNNKFIALQSSNQAFEQSIRDANVSVTPIYYQTMHQLIKAVVAGEVDFTVLDESYAYVAQMVGLEKFIDVAFVLGDQPFPLAFALRNDQPELVSIINKGLASISAQEMLVLKSRWLGGFSSATYGDPNVIPLNPNEAQFLKQHPHISVCVVADALPFEGLTEGKHDGMSKEYLDLLTKRIGLKVSVYPTTSWQQTVYALKNRQCDITTFGMKTTKYPDAIHYTTPIISSPMSIILRQGEPKITGLTALSGQLVAMIKDSSAIDFVRTHYPNIRIFEAINSQQALQTVANQQTQAFVGTAVIAQHTLLKYPELNLRVAATVPHDAGFSVGVRSDYPELGSIFQKAINLMDQAESQQIYYKWVATPYDTQVNYDWLIKVIFIALFFIITILFWSLSLRRERNKTGLALAQVSRMNVLLEDKNQALALLATTDELTGLWNRKKINDTLERELQLSQRQQYCFGVILIDIDLFKSINDTHGHQVGDEILIEFANKLRYLSRQSDVVARWGGEEFMIICPLIREAELMQIAERLRLKVSLFPFTQIGSLTISCGVACYQQEAQAADLIERADKALYRAKKSGRNRVVLG